MPDIKETKKLLDEINAAVASYDPILKEQARDILLKQAFGTDGKKPDIPPPALGGVQVAFHELVEKWTPDTQAEWALLGAYYFQIVQGHQSVTAFQVNKELKQHGTNVANITVCFDENINQTPALMRQTGKSGKSQQAKKTYIVTTNGVNFVKAKLNESKT
jgi:hypothetical protein